MTPEQLQEKIKANLLESKPVIEKRAHLIKKYGSIGERMFEGVVNDRVEKFITESGGIDNMLAIANISDFMNHVGDPEQLFKREIPKGALFSILGETVTIKFVSNEIFVEDEGFVLHQCDSVEDLIEKVSMDMRTKKFRNVIKRRNGDSFCKETEKVDMRMKDFKDTMKRKAEKEEKAKAKQIEEKGDYDEVVATTTSGFLGSIASVIQSQEDFNKLLVAVKRAGLNPLPLKNEIYADAGRILKGMKTNDEISYIIKNAEKYEAIATKMFGAPPEIDAVPDEEEPEQEQESLNERKASWELDPVRRLLKTFNK